MEQQLLDHVRLLDELDVEREAEMALRNHASFTHTFDDRETCLHDDAAGKVAGSPIYRSTSKKLRQRPATAVPKVSCRPERRLLRPVESVDINGSKHTKLRSESIGLKRITVEFHAITAMQRQSRVIDVTKSTNKRELTVDGIGHQQNTIGPEDWYD